MSEPNVPSPVLLTVIGATVGAIVTIVVTQILSGIRNRRNSNLQKTALINAMLEPWKQATQGMTSEQIYHFVQSQQTQSQQQALQVLLNHDQRIQELERRVSILIDYLLKKDFPGQQKQN